MRLRGSLRGTLPVLALLALLALLAHDGMAREPGPRTLQTPQTLLWMWDRPQLFSSPPAGVGIAYLHATVRLSGDQARTIWRQWPLRIAPGVTVVPVVHVTLDNLAPSPVDEAQQQAIAAALEHAAAHNRSGWVQLDFEARRSQREAYAALLERLQPLRERGVRLSATALASWCMGDPWLPAGLLDEVVPMYFRMGADAARIRQRLQATGAATVPACRDAAGLLLGEPWPVLGGVKRRYVFHTGTWKNEDFKKIDTRDANQ
ncbi:hypothetical protein SAMN05216567_12522 [Variovorax sp. OK605]|uniref:hypothetical protein n=1 Tax=Variovorax sp. OK605 TaxID=1855317 RepID=UPI0008F34E46|nr:hypothetical protein [Variovorax sp. OK605]SFQ66729.1 hypothetical protein SAMN05216567_12522 [Variovorax sp. OK605]